MTPTATYIAEESCLQELPQMEKPICINGVSPNLCSSIRKNIGLKECECKIYEEHIKSMRKIPCDPSCKGLWADQQKLVEGKDYEVRACCESNCNGVCEQIGATIWALPLVPVKSEDELWREVCMRIFEKHISKRDDMWIDTSAAISYLKKHYSISIKSQG